MRFACYRAASGLGNTDIMLDPAKPFRAALILVIALTLVEKVGAQDTPSPLLGIGDSWTYRYSLDGAYQWDYTDAVRSLDGSTAEMVTRDSRERRTIVTFDVPTHRYLVRYAFARDGSRGRVLRDDSENSAPLKFPLAVGSEWNVTYRFRVGGDPITQQFHAHVVDKETVRTAGGEFDSFKIEFNGFWQNDEAIGFGAKGRQVETYWYAPSVKRFVRREIKSYGVSLAKMSGVVTYWRVDELISFTSGAGGK